jgi:hypothetical protein
MIIDLIYYERQKAERLAYTAKTNLERMRELLKPKQLIATESCDAAVTGQEERIADIGKTIQMPSFFGD